MTKLIEPTKELITFSYSDQGGTLEKIKIT